MRHEIQIGRNSLTADLRTESGGQGSKVPDPQAHDRCHDGDIDCAITVLGAAALAPSQPPSAG
jgi:hypothetical protein